MMKAEPMILHHLLMLIDDLESSIHRFEFALDSGTPTANMYQEYCEMGVHGLKVEALIDAIMHRN